MSDRVERVFLRALEVRPARRFADVPGFWSALKQAAGSPSEVAIPRPRAGRWGLTATLAAAALLTVGQSATSRLAPSARAPDTEQAASAPPATAVDTSSEPPARRGALVSPAASASSSGSARPQVVATRRRKPHPVAPGSAAPFADAPPEPVPSQALLAGPAPRSVEPLEELFHHDQLSRRK